MYQPKFYKTIDRKHIAEEIRREGFDPMCITDLPGRVYTTLRQPQTKILVFLEGGMKVKVGEKSYDCHPGDKFIIPGNTKHSAIVGPAGCVYFWAEKLGGEH
jgi:mannose-6-phosphate isomerase-like protein (cupin superfamily)